MKRTKSINLDRMRKAPVKFKLKPIVLSIAAFSLVGCSDSRKANIYSSIAHCKNENPSLGNVCESAYARALEKAAKTSPKYKSKWDCSKDFGNRGCTLYTSPQGKKLYMPEMAAFALAKDWRADEEEHESEPLYTSYNHSSGYYGSWTTGDGYSYKKRYGTTTVRGDTFKPKPTVTKTMSRGGFGSTVAAKSSWGGSSYRGGWGG
jgi:uncharacterized protein YgiB involved in biofilm formation